MCHGMAAFKSVRPMSISDHDICRYLGPGHYNLAYHRPSYPTTMESGERAFLYQVPNEPGVIISGPSDQNARFCEEGRNATHQNFGIPHR